MAAGELGKEEGNRKRKRPSRSRHPEEHGKRGCRGEEERHAARQSRHDEGKQPAMAPRFDQEGLGNPIKSGEEIAEAEAESDRRRRLQPFGETRVLRMAAVEQPDERAEGQEQDRPGMDGRESKNGERPKDDGGNRATGAAKARKEGRGPGHHGLHRAQHGASPPCPEGRGGSTRAAIRIPCPPASRRPASAADECGAS